jgi:hypothetical protein
LLKNISINAWRAVCGLAVSVDCADAAIATADTITQVTSFFMQLSLAMT